MLNKLYKSKLFPLLLQIMTLIIFVLLISGGFGITTDDGAFAKQLRNTNLSNLIIWSYWWPLIILTAVFLGRHWCTICPIELLSALASRVGFKRKIPKSIKSGWFITLLYAFIAIVAIHTWGIHRHPHYMALYLCALMGLAIVVSLVFEKRAFCSYFCPVGKLLGLYSLMSKFGLRVKEKDVCASCKTKDCISKAHTDKIIGRSCQSELYPANINDNKACILCTQCVKVCPKDNIAIHPKVKGYASLDLNTLSWAEVGMTAVLIGFICYEVMTSWSFSQDLLLSIPHAIYALIPEPLLPFATFEAVLLFLLIPTTLILLISTLSKMIGKKETLGFYIKRTCGFILPIVAFGHVFKALLKTTSRLPYWSYALEQPDGLFYAKKLMNKEIIITPSEWLNVLIIVIGLVGLMYALSLSANKIIKDRELNIGNKTLYFVIVIAHVSLLSLGAITTLLQ